MPEPHPIITRVVGLRLAAGVSRAAAAKRIGYGRKTVQFWEAGVQEPRLDAVDADAQVRGYRLSVGDGGPVVKALMRARYDAGLTQADVALKLGCTLTAVWRWETGRRGMTLTTATAYAALFGLELELREVPDA